jgi:hypothetical protein
LTTKLTHDSWKVHAVELRWLRRVLHTPAYCSSAMGGGRPFLASRSHRNFSVWRWRGCKLLSTSVLAESLLGPNRCGDGDRRSGCTCVGDLTCCQHCCRSLGRRNWSSGGRFGTIRCRGLAALALFMEVRQESDGTSWLWVVPNLLGRRGASRRASHGSVDLAFVLGRRSPHLELPLLQWSGVGPRACRAWPFLATKDVTQPEAAISGQLRLTLWCWCSNWRERGRSLDTHGRRKTFLPADAP